jgi:excisionase family DNA binding protein
MEVMIYTMDEACSYLRVSRSTLYRLMKAGGVVTHKVGSTYRFYETDLDAAMREVPIEEIPSIDRKVS